MQLDEIRQRITVIAELFEKKPIKQRYSFEVLCDFVHDKAKRLFNKYETAVKDKKALKEHHDTKKVQQLEKETRGMQEAVNTLKTFILPTVMGMLNKTGH